MGEGERARLGRGAEIPALSPKAGDKDGAPEAQSDYSAGAT